jgi:pyruvate kinase
MNLKKTKIIATLGPASGSIEIIKRMVVAGVNVFRINTSHGDHFSIIELVKKVRQVEEKLNTFLGILLDLQGPKIRVGEFKKGFIEIHRNDQLVFTTEKIEGDEKNVPVQYEKFHLEVKPGNLIFLDDGNLSVRVREVNEKKVIVKVENGGILSNYKGLNLPESNLSISPITKKDRADLQVGLKAGVDFVALSFVKNAREIKSLKNLIKKAGATAEVIAKIERNEAIGNLEEILKETDAVMVARGDMGVEISYERVPIVQMDILKTAGKYGKPVIIATQMLESMVHNHRPTRAEVSDVANSVASYADALMLSAETAVGKFPVKAVEVMARSARRMEKYQKENNKIMPWWFPEGEIAPITRGITYAANQMSELLDGKAIVAFTESGRTVKHVSRPKPNIPVFGFTPHVSVARQMTIVRGAYPYVMTKEIDIKKPLRHIFSVLKDEGLIKKGDRIILTSGLPMRVSGTTNMIRVEIVR